MYTHDCLDWWRQGGAGKSTLAQNIAVLCLQQQGQDIITTDADPQGTLYRWATHRMLAVSNDTNTKHIYFS
jgi:cellulose biosynthesis protein BcsQ